MKTWKHQVILITVNFWSQLIILVLSVIKVLFNLECECAVISLHRVIDLRGIYIPSTPIRLAYLSIGQPLAFYLSPHLKFTMKSKEVSTD